jgi:hypothetical protein
MPKDEADFIAAGLFGTGEAIWTTRGAIILECPECLIPIFLLQGYKSRVEDAGTDLVGEFLSNAFQNFQSGQRCPYSAPATIISPWYFNPTVQNDTVPDDGTASLPDSFAPENGASDPDRSLFYSRSRSYSGSGRIQAVYVGR